MFLIQFSKINTVVPVHENFAGMRLFNLDYPEFKPHRIRGQGYQNDEPNPISDSPLEHAFHRISRPSHGMAAERMLMQ